MIYYLVVILKSQCFISIYLVANLLYIDLTPTIFLYTYAFYEILYWKGQKGNVLGYLKSSILDNLEFA